MKIKRLICVLLVVLMVVGLAACGGHVNTETAENANTHHYSRSKSLHMVHHSESVCI